jgi:hypothetical protein
VKFKGIPNDNGYLGKIIVEELTANSFSHAETLAYEVLAPFLSAWSLHLDIPVHVETIQVTSLETHTSSLRVRTPTFEMTFAGGISPILADDFCQYASLYREAMNSNSGFYRFLCFYKIIESISFRRSRTNEAAKQAGQEVRRFHEVIPSNQDELIAFLKDVYQWRTQWDAFALSQIVPVEVYGKRIGGVREKYLNPIRVGIAHALLKTGEVRISLDKLEHIQQVNKWLPLCRVLARMTLRNEFPAEFSLAMKPLFVGIGAARDMTGTGTGVDTLIKGIERIFLSPRVAATVCLVCAALLFGAPLLPAMSPLAQQYRPWIWLCFLASGFYSLTFPVHWAARAANKGLNGFRAKRHSIRRLHALTLAEKHILQWHVEKENGVDSWSVRRMEINSLAHDGLIGLIQQVGNIGYFKLPVEVREYLLRNPALIATPNNPRPPRSGNEWMI